MIPDPCPGAVPPVEGLTPATLEQQLQWARAQDRADALAELRGHFALPRSAAGEELLYFAGHSLGLAPKAARAQVESEMLRWERLGVLAHEQGSTPWIDYAEALQRSLAGLVGGSAAEVIAMNSLSINLHLLLASFYRPSGQRRRILIEAGAFGSDRHVVASQIRWHGLDPQRDLIELAPAPATDLISIESIEAAIAAQGPDLALVLWPGVQYRTGQLFDLGRIARAAHEVGAMAGFDLAHAIGNVPLQLHADAADFAAWCSYKYLNAGPGAIGGAFVHERHHRGAALPRLEGWWGHDPATRFQMSAVFEPSAGAAAWAVSNPPILSAAPLHAALPLFERAGMQALRIKSVALTAYLETLVAGFGGAALRLVSPADPRQRGCQLSWRVCRSFSSASRLPEALARRGVIGDFRQPDILRLAPVPLYNRYEDVLRAAWLLGQVLQAGN
jgi:kynureninase